MLQKSRQSLRTVNISIDADEEKVIISNGNFVKYETGNGNIRIRTNEGVDIIRGVGGSIKVSEYTEIYITNLHTANDAKTITVGYGDVSDNAVSGSVDIDTIINDVNIIKSDTILKAKNSFFGGIYMGPAASNYNHFGVMNPVDSGLNLKVNYLNGCNSGVGITSPIAIHMMEDATILTTVLTGNNCYLGQAASVGVLGRRSTTSQLGTEMSKFMSIHTTASHYNLKNPFLVPPGFTLMLVNPVNLYMLGEIAWKEETI